ncbi:MAG: amino acid ABC transporter permease [Gemmobacter sp.]|jgi:general L-amino acid transport system permease protein|nr:amino acid ABC transporter permease [Gemmobacter sp.]
MTEVTPFVRTEVLDSQEPPPGEQGAVKWLRENLFSSPLNTALTVLGLLVITWLMMHSVPWFMHSIWHANSLSQCREIVTETWGEGATGACWAMIRDRWHQYLYGFYPMDAYWRPNLAFLLMLVALAPVLSQSLPRKLMWFTLLYPFLAYWLLWGGTVWAPVVVMLGFGLMALVFRQLVGRLGVPVSAGVGLIVATVWWLVVQPRLSGTLQSILPLGIRNVDSDQFGGFLLSIVIGITAISASLPMGILLALGRKSDMLLIRTLSIGFIEFIRGVPLITLLFTASLLLQYFLPPETNFDIILRVIILVTFFAAAYLAEVIRGGLAALPRGQYEAADGLGLDYWQAQRLIVMPQALKVSIPGIVSTFIGLFKDTTLVAFVGLKDPLKGVTAIVRADMTWKGIYWEPYIFVGAIFFIICFGMSRYSMLLERRLKTDHR